MRNLLKIILFILFSWNIILEAQNTTYYIPKYNIRDFDINALKQYFDSGYGWKKNKIQKKDGSVINTYTYIVIDKQKKDLFLNSIEAIKKEIQINFDSAMDNCLSRLNAIQNVDSTLSANCIKTAMKNYIEKLKIDSQGNSQKSIVIKIGFTPEYIKYFNLATVQKTMVLNGQSLILNIGTTNINNWVCDKQVDGGTKGDGVITISNGYKDFKARFYETYLNNCRYETYFKYCRSQGFLNSLSKLWKSLGLVDCSFQSLLAHEVIHNALRQETTDTYWHDLDKGRWGDEATVEDIQLKLFPSTSSTLKNNFYEGKFHFAMWWYNYNRFFKLSKNDSTKFFDYYSQDIQRRFNPVYIAGQCELKYKKEKNINVLTTIKGIKYNYKDGTLCDDCRCEELKDYVVPYFKCCGKGRNYVLK